MLEEIANRSQNKYIQLLIVESIGLKEHSMINKCVSYGILWGYTSVAICAWAEESMYQNWEYSLLHLRKLDSRYLQNYSGSYK